MKIIYLIQHQNKPTELLNELLFNNNAVDYIVLTFKEKVDSENFIFAPNTTWSTGRNLLLSSINVKDYDYVIFLDGDIELKSKYNENSYIEFQKCLKQYKPFIATPHYVNHPKTNRISDNLISIDACFNAFRTDKIDLFLPYNPKYDNESWWYSQLLVYDKIYSFGYNQTTQFNEFYVNNPSHGSYPKGINFNKIIEQEFNNKDLCYVTNISNKINIVNLITDI